MLLCMEAAGTIHGHGLTDLLIFSALFRFNMEIPILFPMAIIGLIFILIKTTAIILILPLQMVLSFRLFRRLVPTEYKTKMKRASMSAGFAETLFLLPAS